MPSLFTSYHSLSQTISAPLRYFEHEITIMDPLSLTAGIIAIIGASGEAAKVVRRIASLKGAPDVILALNNEIADLGLLVSAIEHAYQNQQNGGVPLPGNRIHSADVEASIVSSLKQVNDRVLELQAFHTRLIRSTPGSSSSTVTSLNKSVWLVEQKRVKRLQDDFRSARLKLVTALGVLNE